MGPLFESGNGRRICYSARMRSSFLSISGCLFLFVLAAPMASAQAQQDRIIIIHKDGTSEEFKVPSGGAPVKSAPAPAPAPKIHTWVEPVPAVKREDPPPAPPAPQKPSVAKSAAARATPVPAQRPENALPIPPRKPDAESRKPYRPYKWALPEGHAVTSDAALRIALEVAPPARSFEVSRRIYQDRPVFQVTFKTEGGFHDVLVDAQTGEILKK